MTIQQQMQQIQQPQPPSDAARLFAVEKDVAGLKETLSALATSVNDGFRNISAEMKARSTTNWQPVQIGLTVVTIAGGIFFTWVNANTSRIEAAIAKQEARAERYVPREDLDTRFAVISQRRDDLQRLTDARIERVERDVDTVQKMLVPRGEHDERAAAQRQKDEGLQRQIDDLRKGQAELNTPRDAFLSMQRRIDELERGRRPPG